MSDLKILVENYFAPKKKTLTKQMLYEIFDEVIKEQEDQLSTIINFLINNGYKGAREKLRTRKRLTITNMGGAVSRDKAITKLKNEFGLTPTKTYDRDPSKFIGGKLPDELGGMEIVLKKGTPPEAGKVSNKGDIAEGILGAAILVAFQLHNEQGGGVTKQSIKDTINLLNKFGKNISSGKKEGRELKTTFKDAVGPEKEISLKVVLNKGNYDDFVATEDELKLEALSGVYSNVIRFVNSNYFQNLLKQRIGSKSRGIENRAPNFSIKVTGAEDQLTSKADLTVLAGNETFLSYSLKKDSRQLGQVGGKTFENVAAWMNKIFGADISKFTDEYMDMLKAPDIPTYYNLIEKILKDIKQSIDLDLSSQDEEIKKKKVGYLLNALKYSRIL